MFLQAHNFFRGQELIFNSFGEDHGRLLREGYAVPALTLGAFASELFLKCLIGIETGREPPHVHDLRELYDQLSEASRNEIERLWNNYLPYRAAQWDELEKASGRKIPRALPDALQAGGLAFEFLRYRHEGPKEGFESYGLDDLPHMLGNRILQLKPDWLELPWEGKELYFDEDIEKPRAGPA